MKYLGEEKVVREESQVFSELERLCVSPGYLHAIAFLSFKYNTISYDDSITPDDVLEQFGMDRLVRTEISTLIGLACKGDLSESMPGADVLQAYITKTEDLLEEIHKSMMPDIDGMIESGDVSNKDFNPFERGDFLRESIFYSGESAYYFQYRDLSLVKYKDDSDWLSVNKGYSTEDAVSVISAISKVQNRKINDFIPSLDMDDPDSWTPLDAYKFTSHEVSEESGVELSIVINVIESFSSDTDMSCFSSLSDFNPKNAYPIIRLSGSEYLLLQGYSLVEALYETPFFWFYGDKSYRNTAMNNRGNFTESFSAHRLSRVFGKKNVFTNVLILDSRKNIACEIDVLVVYSDRAIVLQAKSKKLTIASRKGNDLKLRDDFKKAVQDAYDQAFHCAELLIDPSYKVVDSNGVELKIERDLSEIYPFCVVSDHYPALSFQARQFLKFSETEKIRPPFVMDVFFLDVATEFLETPLYFLSYVKRRTDYNQRIMSTHELTILSFHIKQNLWVSEEYTMLHLSDDICADLDAAMLVRRCGFPGSRTPEGILTKYVGTTLGQLIKQIEKEEHSATIDFGLLLLLFSEDTLNQLNNGIDNLAMRAIKDKKSHDLTIAVGSGSTGLTIHCNFDALEVASANLKRHIEVRKYSQRAKEWFGICLDPRTKAIRFGLKVSYDWERSDELDRILADSPKPQRKINTGTVVKGRKVGRNEICPCGSGIKFKKCCIN